MSPEVTPKAAAWTIVCGALALLALKLSGLCDFETTIDTAALGLAVLASVVLMGIAAPQTFQQLLDRLESVKTPVGELGFESLARAERAQVQLPVKPDPIEHTDEVQVSARRGGGTPLEELQEVRDKLHERLRFVRDAILDLDANLSYAQVIDKVRVEDLLKPEEFGLVQDIDSKIGSEVEEWPQEVRTEFLDASWKFAIRFGTLIFERLTRKRLKEAGWFVADFEQDPGHRPDFLCYRDGVWLQVAARVQPNRMIGTRRRLTNETAPFDPLPVIVIPNSQDFEPDEKFEKVDVVQLRPLLERE